jgi:hypothetical protein
MTQTTHPNINSTACIKISQKRLKLPMQKQTHTTKNHRRGQPFVEKTTPKRRAKMKKRD